MRKTLKMINKIFVLLLALTLSFALVSCNDDDVPDYVKDAKKNDKNKKETVKLDTPVVVISKQGLASWSVIENAKGYSISVNGVVTQSTETSYQLVKGDKISVAAIPTDEEKYKTSDYSAIQEYKGLEQLSTPVVTVTKDGLASWEAISNATGYVVRIDGFEMTQSETTYQFASDGIIEVKAINNTGDYQNSGFSAPVEYKALVKLNAPTISISETGLASWTAIKNSTGYIVYINNNDPITQTELSIQLSENDKIYVIAKGNETEYINSDASVTKTYIKSVVELDKLATPVVTIAGLGNASWQAITGAIGYSVKVNGVEVEQTGTTYTLADGDKIFVKALGDLVTNKDSDYSIEVTYVAPKKLGTPVVSINKLTGLASWQAISGATGYQVTINGTKKNQTTLSVELSDGDIISVKALGDNQNNTDSLESEAMTYVAPIKLAMPEVSIASGIASWAAVANATSYDVKVNGVTTNQTGLTVNVVYNDVVSVRAVGDNYNYLTSDWTLEQTYVKGLMAELTYPNYPDTVVEEGKQSWDYIPADNDMTITWYVDVSSWVMPTGKDEVSKAIYDKTGIKVKFETPVADDGQKLTTMIAGDLLPDIVTVPTANAQRIAALAQQGYVYDINTLASKWAPTLYQNLPADVWNWWAYGNNKTYGIPNHYYSYEDVPDEQLQPNGGLMVREDIYNAWQAYMQTRADASGNFSYTSQYGSQVGVTKTVPYQGYITTPEGFKEACNWALTNYKGTTAGKITTGLQLSQFTSQGCTSLNWLSQFFAIPFEDQNGNYVYQFTTEAYKNMLLYLNDLYKDGIITDANFTQDYSGVGGVIAGAQCFASLATPQDYQMHFVTAKSAGYRYVSLYITNGDGDAPVLADIRGYGYLMNMITTSCKRPDIVIKLFDYLTSDEGQLLITLGVEGDTWNYTDESKTATEFTQKYLDDKKAGTATKYGLMQFDLLINYQYYDNMQPRVNNGKTEDEVYRTDLKRPLSIYAYDYNVMHFVVDATDTKFSTYLDAMANIESVVSKQLPKIIKATNNTKATEIYNTTVSYMNKSNLELVITMQSEAYNAAKIKLGLTYGWIPYQEGYNQEPDRLHPNGDLSLYRGTY